MVKTNDSVKEKELRRAIEGGKLPRHIAFIMDGNGRWAQKQSLPRVAGHEKGVETLRSMVTLCNEISIKVVTFYAFSTENWKRPSSEVDFLLALPEKYLNQDLPELIKNNVRIKVTGNPEALPSRARKSIDHALSETRMNDGMILNLAINYGGRDEIVRAARIISLKVKSGELSPENINETLFANFLYTRETGDPDLLIRTSGEQRVSNFLLWQIAYSELLFTPVLWPEYTKLDLLEAIQEYQRRQRRFGGIYT